MHRSTATPLVLLPGMMCDARLFGPQIARFSRDRAIHLARVTDAPSIEALASICLDQAPDRFALAGLSMGGIVAMEMVRQSPERIVGLCLMDTNPKAEAEAIRAMREPQIARALAGELRSVMRDEMKPNYLHDGPKRQDVLDLCLDMAMGLGSEVFERQSRALQSRPDQQKTLRQVDVPTLVLCGEDDRLCPIHRHELMRDLIQNARLQVIEGAGHLPVLERPDETNEAIARWLADVDERPARST